MDNILNQIAICIERGKINQGSPYPPDLAGQKGADELTKEALSNGIPAGEIVEKGLIVGMEVIGKKFGDGSAFVPDILIAAKAMKAAMAHIRPYFQSGEVKKKGTLIIGTVTGDLHDIGKNLVAMIIEGAGWEVVDLGVDVSAEKFISALEKYPDACVGLSALLTTTMGSMEKIVSSIKKAFPDTKIIIGGAPINSSFAEQIGADMYSPDPHGALALLEASTK